jgi:hypothetical protein
MNYSYDDYCKNYANRSRFAVEMTSLSSGTTLVTTFDDGQVFKIQVSNEKPIRSENADIVLDKYYPFLKTAEDPFYLLMERLN